jgi:predicted TIM-barrel fold metal-dependent hydrolase
MSTASDIIRELHHEAIALLKEAGDPAEAPYREALAKALPLEEQAARLLRHEYKAQPTRAVLFRSAASMAMALDDYDKAKELITLGLQGEVHTELAAELLELRAKIDDTASTTEKGQFINCHTHIFTGDYVPPYLARSLAPLGSYKLVPITPFVKLFRWWFTSSKSPYKWQFQSWHKRITRGFYRARTSLSRYWVLRIVKNIVAVLIFLSLFHLLFDTTLIKEWLIKKEVPEGFVNWIKQIDKWLVGHGILRVTGSFFVKALLLVILCLFYPTGRNLLWFILKNVTGLVKVLPGKTTTELIKRYIDIVRFARYKRQSDIFTKLTNQYPQNAGMVVLPMDMTFMGAGDPPKLYGQQMEELAALKKNRPGKIFPFVFIDPRRTEVAGKVSFNYTAKEGIVTLQDCFVKDYIEDKQFSGLKIYPALGYYPFDEKLLPLWKYAADNGIPLMTHCIRGVIYYRGPKLKEWDYHPVFLQSMTTDKDRDLRTPQDDEENEESQSVYEPLLLPQTKPVAVQEIFSHPLNYACLLKREWLAKLVGQAKDQRVRDLFGYAKVKTGDEETESIQHGLEHLKICFGHFGGEDEWDRFFQKDRDNYASQLMRKPFMGIDFLGKKHPLEQGKPEYVWKYVDWYSIICSLMLQHENVYADISYILHADKQILPLLKQTLRHPVLKERVLYGSDFYVVRNHKSDKNMLADMMGGLEPAEIDQLARINPVAYLQRKDLAGKEAVSVDEEDAIEPD